MENHVNGQLDKASREIERLRYELTDMIDRRQEFISKRFDEELKDVQTRYNSCISNVDNASNNLGDLFKGKMLKIKSTLSNQLA